MYNVADFFQIDYNVQNNKFHLFLPRLVQYEYIDVDTLQIETRWWKKMHQISIQEQNQLKVHPIIETRQLFDLKSKIGINEITKCSFLMNVKPSFNIYMIPSHSLQT